MSARDASARKQESVRFFWNKTAVGDSVAVFLRKLVLNARFVKARTSDIMHVEVEMGTEYYGVGVLTGA